MAHDEGEVTLQLPAEWTDDCQGKKDYDANIVALSTRYWPRGGGYSVFSREGGWEDNDSRPQIPPSARAQILLRAADEDVELAGAGFEAESQEEVQRQVEVWSREQYQRIVRALRREFATG